MLCVVRTDKCSRWLKSSTPWTVCHFCDRILTSGFAGKHTGAPISFQVTASVHLCWLRPPGHPTPWQFLYVFIQLFLHSAWKLFPTSWWPGPLILLPLLLSRKLCLPPTEKTLSELLAFPSPHYGLALTPVKFTSAPSKKQKCWMPHVPPAFRISSPSLHSQIS